MKRRMSCVEEIQRMEERAEYSRRAMLRQAGRTIGRCICDLPEKLLRRDHNPPQHRGGGALAAHA